MAKKSAKTGKPRASPLKSSVSRKEAETRATAPAATVPHASKYTVGDHISHPMFGDGTVKAIDSNKLTIEFTNKVVKQIVDDYVKPRKP